MVRPRCIRTRTASLRECTAHGRSMPRSSRCQQPKGTSCERHAKKVELLYVRCANNTFSFGACHCFSFSYCPLQLQEVFFIELFILILVGAGHRDTPGQRCSRKNRAAHTCTVASSPSIDFLLGNQLLSHLCGDRLTHEAC